ncbi:MAG: peptidoglycan-binding domain-containing protein [Pseudomonadota bacterium]
MKHNKLSLVGGCVLLLGTAACSTMDENARISDLETKLEQSEQDKVKLEEQVAVLKEQEPGVQYVNSSGSELLPPNAKAGECYARVFVPSTYKTVSERVLKNEASERVEVIPAKYEWVEEEVLVREESERVEIVPATYKQVTEQVLVRPASERLETVPAVYETVSEQILVREAYTTWKKGRGPIEKIDQATGEIMCLVEVPAEYKTVTKRVLATPETVRKIPVPAQYETVTKTVVDQAATTRTVKIPAEYGTVKVSKLVEPASERRIPIPAEYQTVNKTEQVSEGHLQWRSILCETNVTPDIVSRIQEALLAKGYNPGPIDGVLGSDTMAAVKDFQQSNQLPSGQLTLDTLKALGVAPQG